MYSISNAAAQSSVRRANWLALTILIFNTTAFVHTTSAGAQTVVPEVVVSPPDRSPREPIAALDPLHQLQVMELLRQTSRGGHGVMVVLHDLSLAARFCDRLVLLAHGGVLTQGRPEQVLTDDHVAGAYGVDVVRGEHDGVPFFLLPWTASRRIEGASQ
jgi:ABC-type histidine transport system ATPase subunit